MTRIYENIKKFIKSPALHGLLVALTAMYLMFGVLNAGFILVQVLASLVDFFLNHLPTDWNIVNVWDRGIVFG